MQHYLIYPLNHKCAFTSRWFTAKVIDDRKQSSNREKAYLDAESRETADELEQFLREIKESIEKYAESLIKEIYPQSLFGNE